MYYDYDDYEPQDMTVAVRVAEKHHKFEVICHCKGFELNECFTYHSLISIGDNSLDSGILFDIVKDRLETGNYLFLEWV